MKNEFCSVLILLTLMFSLAQGYGSEKVVLDAKNFFPLVYWGGVGFDFSGKKINLGFCEAEVTAAKNKPYTEIKGHSVGGKVWKIILENIGVHTAISGKEGLDVYLGDLAQNGMTDMIIAYNPMLSGSGFVPDAEFLIILFDRKGLPHPMEFDFNTDYQPLPFKNLIRDSKGRAVLVCKEGLSDSEDCYATLVRANNTKWEKLLVKNIKIKNAMKGSELGDCLKKDDPAFPDYENLDESKYKVMKSYEYKNIVGSNNPDLELLVSDENGSEKTVNAYKGANSIYFVFEQKDETAIVDYGVSKDVLDPYLDKAVAKNDSLNIVQPHNGYQRFIWFSEPLAVGEAK